MVKPALTEYKEAFEMFDKGTHKILFKQVGNLARALGEDPTNLQVLKVLGNPNKEGSLVYAVTWFPWDGFTDTACR